MSTKKKLLFILQYFYPDVTGFSQMLGDLTTYLCNEEDYECTVVAGSTVRATKEWKHLPNRLGKVRIRRIRTLRSGKKTLIHRLIEYSTYYTGVIGTLIFRNSYDAVICFTTPPLIGFAAIIGLAFSRTPLIYYVQDLYPELMFDMGYIKSPWLMRKLSLVNHLILRRANRIITIGKWMARKIQRNYEIEPSSIEIVENWALNVAFSPPNTAGPFVILYTGNIGLAHDFTNFPALLDALDQIENIEVRFIGAGRQSSLAAKMMGKHSKIRHAFSGYVERSELDRTLASGHMFLIAQSERAVGDILPSKLYSYIAAGRPLLYLGTRKSEIGELISNSKLGAIIECRDDLGNAVQMIKEYERRGASYLSVCERARRLYDRQMGFAKSARQIAGIIQGVFEN